MTHNTLEVKQEAAIAQQVIEEANQKLKQETQIGKKTTKQNTGISHSEAPEQKSKCAVCKKHGEVSTDNGNESVVLHMKMVCNNCEEKEQKFKEIKEIATQLLIASVNFIPDETTPDEKKKLNFITASSEGIWKIAEQFHEFVKLKEKEMLE